MYNLLIIMYTFNKDKGVETVTDFMTRGAFNARHVFLAFVNDNHFQPMTPNDYFGWEFQIPRITRGVVAKYTDRKERKVDAAATAAGHGISLSWRLELTDKNDEVHPPLPTENILGGMTVKPKTDILKQILWK